MLKVEFIKTCSFCGKKFRTERLWNNVCEDNCPHAFEKVKAAGHLAISRAIKEQRIAKENCYCGKPALAHHDDYSKPENVIWLCHSHHKLRHTFLELKKVGLV